MADEFCYLFGAGASCNALPLVAQIPERLDRFINNLDDWSKRTGLNSKELSEASKWLLESITRHATIDTFAKKLYIRNEQKELKRLKAVTSCFFVFEQAANKVDERYDTFFASIINSNIRRTVELPSNISILSWNYDTQLEKSYYGFCDNEDQVVKDITFNTSIKRLNGYCGTNPPGHLGNAYKAAIQGTIYDGYDSIVELYNEYMKDEYTVHADINFAWESEKNYVLREISSIITKATVLVIIGYSFPFFNRQIDSLILNNMDSLGKVYIQVPEINHNGVNERIRALMEKVPEMIFLKDLSSFYIPFNYV